MYYVLTLSNDEDLCAKVQMGLNMVLALYQHGGGVLDRSAMILLLGKKRAADEQLKLNVLSFRRSTRTRKSDTTE